MSADRRSIMQSEIDLNIPANRIIDFLAEAQRCLSSTRSKTQFGRWESTHWIQSAVMHDEVVYSMVVALVVRSRRTKKGDLKTEILLTDVRPPGTDETNDTPAQLPWPDGLAEAARALVLQSLKEAARNVADSQLIVLFRRNYLAFSGHRLSGEYRGGGWRLAAPVFPVDPEAPPSLHTGRWLHVSET